MPTPVGRQNKHEDALTSTHLGPLGDFLASRVGSFARRSRRATSPTKSPGRRRMPAIHASDAPGLKGNVIAKLTGSASISAALGSISGSTTVVATTVAIGRFDIFPPAATTGENLDTTES